MVLSSGLCLSRVVLGEGALSPCRLLAMAPSIRPLSRRLVGSRFWWRHSMQPGSYDSAPSTMKHHQENTTDAVGVP